MRGDFFISLAHCYNLETLDVSGGLNIDDAALNFMEKCKPTREEKVPACGQHFFPYLHTVKFAQLQITDHCLFTLCKIAPNIEHLELTKCDKLTEQGVLQTLLKNPKQRLEFLDVNYIPSLTYTILDQIRQEFPNLLIRRFKDNDIDTKDSGLRVPRMLLNAKKKKKKKGKGKKKK